MDVISSPYRIKNIHTLANIIFIAYIILCLFDPIFFFINSRCAGVSHTWCERTSYRFILFICLLSLLSFFFGNIILRYKRIQQHDKHKKK